MELPELQTTKKSLNECIPTVGACVPTALTGSLVMDHFLSNLNVYEYVLHSHQPLVKHLSDAHCQNQL